MENHPIPTRNDTSHGETTHITKTITFPPQTILIMERQHILKTTSYSPPKTVLTMEIQHKLQKTSPSPNHTKHGKTTNITPPQWY